ncbi:MAG: ABC transporter ATP-binding protein [Ruminococcaceae bacterium]|nr:ABC transporter ATP-binding protein [Oscillospiraceae bacterium]
MEFVISHLVKSYGSKQVLKDCDFVFGEGRIYGLLGRNGSGKTTFFNCINSDIDINSGEFYFRSGNDAQDKVSVLPEDIGYVVSTPTVPEFMTGREFLKFFIEVHEDITPDKTIDEYFDYMMIPEDDRDRLLKDYSHGTKNKMQMLVNIIAKPRLMLLDEPLTSLDVIVAEEMKNVIRRQKEGRITIFSTHLLDVAVDLCDEIVLLNHGRLEPIDKNNLGDNDFKEKIIAALRDEEDA